MNMIRPNSLSRLSFNRILKKDIASNIFYLLI